MREPNLICAVCKKQTVDSYTATNKCWREAGFKFRDNCHIKCLEERLGRPFIMDDFPECPLNCLLSVEIRREDN